MDIIDTHSATYLREHLKEVLDKVSDDAVTVRVTRRNGEDVMIVSATDYASIMETLYLLSSETTRRELEESLATPLEDCISWEEVKRRAADADENTASR